MRYYNANHSDMVCHMANIGKENRKLPVKFLCARKPI